MRVVLATRNPHKAVEIGALLPGVALVALDAFPDVGELGEDHDTFDGNALQKAREAFAATGLPALADDSGLEVDALGGAPGVFSRRFHPSGEDAANNTLLLERLAGVTDRTARFRCVVAGVDATGAWCVEGRCEGRIALALRGTHGFGYDPLFLPDEAPGRTLAELDLAEKNRISHRGRAFAQVARRVISGWPSSR